MPLLERILKRLDPRSWWNQPISLSELNAIASGIRDQYKKSLRLTPLEWAMMKQIHLGNDGGVNLQSGSGEAPVVEANSTNNYNENLRAKNHIANSVVSARLKDLGFVPYGVEYPLIKGSGATLQVAGGAGAAAQQTVIDSSSIAGIVDSDKVYLEKLHISCLCATETDNMILTLSSNDATPTELMRLAINGMTSQMVDVMLDLGDAYDAGNPTYGDIVAQGLAGLNPMTDNDLVYLTPYYRVI